MPLVEESCMSMMEIFERFTETDIRQLLKTSSNAFYAVDPVLIRTVKERLNLMISPITKIVNKSLSLSVFARSMKAVCLDCNILNNYIFQILHFT